MKERLAHIKNRMDDQKVAAYYIWYNPSATLTYETEEATEDILWMISEIQKLRVENHDLRSPRYSAVLKKLQADKLGEKPRGGGKNRQK
jgi:hypothetical protein